MFQRLATDGRALPAMALALLLGGPAVTPPAQAQAPSGAATPSILGFSCQPRPARRVERALCADPALLEAEQGLASLTEALARLGPDAAAPLRAQQDWRQRRERMCAPGFTADCLRIAAAEREAYLRAQLTEARQAASTPEAPSAAPASPPPTPALAPPVMAETPPAPTPPAPIPGVPTPTPPVSASPLAEPAPPALPPPRAMPATGCGAVSSQAIRQQPWQPGQSPFGLPFEQWTQQDYTALIGRMTECQAENGEGERNIQLLRNLLSTLRDRAPIRGSLRMAPPVVPPAASRPAPAPVTPAAAPPSSAQPLQLECGDPALLQDVLYLIQSQAEAGQGARRVQRLSDPRPYTDVILQSYAATPALQEEYRRLQPYMAPVPQCLVDAATDQGPLTFSYRLYLEGGSPNIEVRRAP